MKNFALLAALAATVSAASAQEARFPYCQIVDRPLAPVHELHLGYVASADAGGPEGGETAVVEEQARVSLGYYRTSYGDLDLGLAWDTWVPMDAADAGLPDQFGRLYLDTHWDLRTRDAFTFRTEFMPGLYSDYRDLGGGDLYLPFGISGIQAFSEYFSVRIGVRIYPGFDRDYDPVVLARFSPTDNLLFDLGYPVSRVWFQPFAGWTLQGVLEFRRPDEFHLEDGDAREQFRFADTRLYGEAAFAFTPILNLVLRAGVVRDRTIDFQSGAPDRIHLDDATFVSLGISGQL